MKQFNKLLLALFFCLSAVITMAQGETCANAIPAPAGNYGASIAASDTLWFSYTATGNGFLTISSCNRANPTADTRMFLYSGTCANLATLATSDNDCGLSAMVNDVPVENGKTYFIMWDNKSATDQLNFDFTTSFRSSASFAPPVNDNICNALTIPMGGSLMGQSNEDASVQGPAEYNLGIPAVSASTQFGWVTDNNVHNTVWFKFTATSTGVVDVNVSANFDVQAAMFSGSCSNISGLSLMSANDDGNSAYFRNYCVTAGQTYFIMVDGFGAESGDFDISVSEADISRPFIALADVTTNPVFGALCPGADNYNINGSLVVAADSSMIPDVDYVNSLKYSWKDGSNAVVGTSAALVAVGEGTYTLTITDTCGSTFTKSVTLSDTTIAALDLVLGATTNPTCVGQASGTATLTHTGGYRFNDGTWAATDSLKFTYRYNASTSASNSVLAASPLTGVANLNVFQALYKGSYRVYLEDACGTVDSVTFVLTDPSSAPIQLDSITAKNPICPGTATGSFDLFAAGGEGLALMYDWRLSTDGGLTYGATFATTQDLDGITEGTYRVVVSDPCGHLDNDTLVFTLVDPIVDALSFTSTQSNPSSYSAADGSIALTVSGGLPNYSVKWWVDGNLWSNYNNMLSLTDLAQGIYRVLVEDTCASAGVIDTTFVLIAPLANDLACDAISISSADSLLTYSNVGATAGESVTIPYSNDEGYTGWADVNLNRSVWFKFVAPSSGAASFWVKHYQGLNANLNFDPQVAVIDAANCAGPYTVLAANDNNHFGSPVNDSYLEVFCLNPGQTYYLLVDGYQGIGQEGIFQIDMDVISIDPIAYSPVAVQPNCINETGSIEISNITGGVYRDAPEQYIYTYSVNGGTAGTVEVDAFGDIVKVDGANASSLFWNNLAAGNYNIEIKDVCGTIAAQTVVIAPIVFTPFELDYSLEQPYCPGYNSGEITFNITGGGTPGDYSYVIRMGASNGPIVNSGNYSSSFPDEVVGIWGAGLYYLQVFDQCQNANTKEFVFELTDRVLTPFAAAVTPNEPTCPMTASGSVDIELTGGRMEAYAELYKGLSFVDDASFSDSHNFDGLDAGTYTVYIYDNCNGDTTVTFTLTDPTADPIVVADSTVNPSAIASNDGKYFFTISEGYPDYVVNLYLIDNFAGNVVSTVSAAMVANEDTTYMVGNLAAGIYRLAINDACGDMINADEIVEFELKNPPANNNVCDAEALTLGTPAMGSNVAATVEAGEALITPSLNEDCDSFQGWCFNNGIDASVWYSFTVPASGTFKIEVASGDFDPQVAVYTAENCNSFTGFTLVAANDDKAISPLNSNAYVEVGCMTPGTMIYVLVDAADGNDGSFTITASENNSGALSVLGNITNSSTEVSSDGSIDVLVTGGTKPYTYAWADGPTTEDRSGLAQGTYTVTVTDKCGNTASKTFDLIYTSVSNDNVCNAIMVPADGVVRQYNNTYATIQPGEAAIAPNSAGTDCFGDNTWCNNDGLDGSVWFKFVAPSANVTVSLCNNAQNEIDPQLAVYSAALCSEFSTFTMIGANDDSQTCSFGSELNLTGLTPCATYYVMVDSDSGDKGMFGIAVIDNNSTLNAGNDSTVTLCTSYGAYNLLNAVTSTADQDGEFTANSSVVAGGIINTGAMTPGTYTYTYTVADSCGNTRVAADYASITVVIKNCTGVEELANLNAFEIYPNPNNGVFNVKASEADVLNIDVFDMTGKLIFNKQVTVDANSNTVVNMEGSAKGVYTLRVNAQSGASQIARVIVQ